MKIYLQKLDIHDADGKGDDLINRLKISPRTAIVMFADELGKYFICVSKNQDIMFLQNLAEVCNRSNEN